MVLKTIGMLLGVGSRGSGVNAVKETVEVFRENAEAGAQRAGDLDAATLQQMASEFSGSGSKGWFSSLVDGMNRLPRPLMVFACFGLLVYTPLDPVHMAEVFASWALIPTGMWAIIGTIVAFYFGGRAQIKEINFQKELAATVALAPKVLENMQDIREMRSDSPGAADPGTDSATALAAVEPSDNPALDDWRASRV
ncbi:MAG: 3TM-type holin [Pseudomonadota bacterium]